jgi:hypothetical protein
MKIFSKVFYLLVVLAFVASCTKNDAITIEPIRDRATQYAKDLDSIDQFLDTHSMEVDGNYNVVFSDLETGSTVQSIRQQTQFPLTSIQVQDPVDDFEYKVYYISMREGEGRKPSEVDSVHVAYKGLLLSNTSFDSSNQPLWFQLEDVVPGWSSIIPLFKTAGFYDTTEGPEPINFQNYGAGIMFLPSGLGYFANSTPSGSISAYEPLIFSFKLMELRYKDHDRDGVLSKDEGNPADPTVKLLDYDLDLDGIANFLDVDDDGDKILTRLEVTKNADGSILFEDCDNDGIPNYLDADSCP